MLEPDGSYKTTDMALATVLTMNGYTPRMGRVGREVEFTIACDDVDGFMEQLVEDYIDGSCRVEPKRFVRELRAVRKDVYRLMDHTEARRGTKLSR